MHLGMDGCRQGVIPGCGLQSSSLDSQERPYQCGVHAHTNVPNPREISVVESVHVPPFWHGDDRQGATPTCGGFGVGTQSPDAALYSVPGPHCTVGVFVAMHVVPSALSVVPTPHVTPPDSGAVSAAWQSVSRSVKSSEAGPSACAQSVQNGTTTAAQPTLQLAGVPEEQSCPGWLQHSTCGAAIDSPAVLASWYVRALNAVQARHGTKLSRHMAKTRERQAREDLRTDVESFGSITQLASPGWRRAAAKRAVACAVEAESFAVNHAVIVRVDAFLAGARGCLLEPPGGVVHVSAGWNRCCCRQHNSDTRAAQQVLHKPSQRRANAAAVLRGEAIDKPLGPTE